MKPSIGRIVHFVQKSYNGNLIHLPAIIVAVWGDTCVNLQVFTDGSNSELNEHSAPNANVPSIKWITSATYNENTDQPYSWHWPEKVD